MENIVPNNSRGLYKYYHEGLVIKNGGTKVYDFILSSVRPFILIWLFLRHDMMGGVADWGVEIGNLELDTIRVKGDGWFAPVTTYEEIISKVSTVALAGHPLEVKDTLSYEIRITNNDIVNDRTSHLYVWMITQSYDNAVINVEVTLT